MDVKSIYYTSNSSSSKYPMNTRTSFVNQIDEHEFHYIDNKSIQVGLKGLTFENRYSTFTPKYGSPNMIIVQDNYGEKANTHHYEVRYGPDLPEINIQSGLDYYLLSDLSPPYRQGKFEALRGFTDVKISGFFPTNLEGIFQRFIVHNLYFHESTLESDRELISYLNHVFRNIEFDVPTYPQAREELFRLDRENKVLFDIDKDGFSIFYDKRYMGLDIFVSNDLCQILGFTGGELEDLQYNSLRGLLYTNFIQKKTRDRSGDLFKAEDLKRFTEDENIRELIDFSWGETHKYCRISQDSNVRASFGANVTSNREIDLAKGGPVLLGLRTSLTKPDIFKNCVYDTQIEFLNVRDRVGGVQVFEVHHPTLHQTTIEKISNAKFELIDIDTGERPNFSQGTPTYIHFHVINKEEMSTRFNIFLDSSDKLSSQYFPTNSCADFRIKLPERLVFGRKWEIALKNIFISNDLFNIYGGSCWISIEIAKNPPSEPVLEDFFDKKIYLEDGLYKTVKELCEYIQTLFEREKLKLKISLRNKTNQVKITCGEARPSGGYLKYIVTISPMLANILGFDRTNLNNFVIPFRILRKSLQAAYAPNIELLTPRNFMILCDLVSESVFGSKSVNILKLCSTNFDRKRKILTFSSHQDEFVELAIKEFASIHIRIVDTTGNPIKSGGTYPTRCQIQFRKK